MKLNSMKNLVGFVAITILLLSCGKNNDSYGSKVVIKGTISSAVNVKSSKMEPAKSLFLSDTRNILVFNSSGSYSVFSVHDSTFESTAAPGTAIAVSFLDADNKFIGCLHAGGLNVLPLVSLKDGDHTVINLSTLTLDGTDVVPANNPLENEIGLNANEIEWYRELGSYYESLSKNIDVDDDGVPDMLVKKQILISTHYSVSVGKWGINNTQQPQVNDTSRFNIVYEIRVSGGSAITPANSSAVLTGPEGDPYADITQGHYSKAPDGFIAFFARETDNIQSLPFKKGIYTLTLDGINYKLNYSNVCPKHFLIIPQPTFHTNASNEVASVSIDYELPDHSSINAENFVYLVQLQISGQNMSRLYEVGGLFTSPNTNPNVEKYNFKLPTPIPLSEITNMSVNYQDLLGNEYDIGWNNE
jgi:hypothetical protein